MIAKPGGNIQHRVDSARPDIQWNGGPASAGITGRHGWNPHVPGAAVHPLQQRGRSLLAGGRALKHDVEELLDDWVYKIRPVRPSSLTAGALDRINPLSIRPTSPCAGARSAVDRAALLQRKVAGVSRRDA